MSPPQITILYFAAASTAVGQNSEVIDLPISDDKANERPQPLRLSSLSALLIARHPGTKLGEVLRDAQWSVDAEMVDDPDAVLLKGGEEVAVICPVSGG
ncbi:hypothetical protein BD626DRAFT_518481 [Schizophyllum amplum]|uniref:Sulfur carrier protein MOCS2A n=1 Tax=Schizophyllum amplum TaxID=97359 RepID=A0A550BVR6_9AGAR|nr:hypothetical protein BD626DRAFT_518481 [Auriculariopsis ampla]